MVLRLAIPDDVVGDPSAGNRQRWLLQARGGWADGLATRRRDQRSQMLEPAILVAENLG